MTEANANGPSGGSQATTAQTATVIADKGSNGDGGIKVAGPLSEENRALVEAKKWASDDGSIDLNKVLSGYSNVEAYSKQTLKLPGENATAEDWNALYTKLGRPEKADGYELKLNAETIPEGFPYDENSAVEFRNWAHEAGLSPRQAQLLHDKFVAHQAGTFTASAEQAARAEGDTHRDLTTAWGSPESEPYKRNVELAGRAISQLGVKAAFIESGVMSKDGAIRNASIAKAMAKVGSELYAEDSMALTANGVLSNPFSDGANFNRTKQGELLRSDPKKAKALIQAAGKNPVEYGLS